VVLGVLNQLLVDVPPVDEPPLLVPVVESAVAYTAPCKLFVLMP
jgi:hypothetical protein